LSVLNDLARRVSASGHVGRSDGRGALLDYVVDITEDATRVTRDTLDGLRAHGFDDRGILQIALIASWFNYINRVADALGVGRDDMATSCMLPIPGPASWASSTEVAGAP
jgi:alkylhydroperoxidase family enzyme